MFRDSPGEDNWLREISATLASVDKITALDPLNWNNLFKSSSSFEA